MSSRQTTQMSPLAARLKDVEHYASLLVGHRPEDAIELAPDDDPAIELAPAAFVPDPRRSRVFLRHGEGHGEFSELTLIGPRSAAD